ncbi:MAG TPA: PAS domain S-box protein, partial [Spirochaetia bacterium]|nr:PAS domain S-box protein [Spirochaetia bacterium]
MSPSQEELPQEPPRQDEQSLQGRLHSIYRANPAGMGVVANRILVEVNDRLCRMTGYTAEELLGNDARLLYVSDEEYERVGRRGFAQAEDEGTTTTETLWRRKDGSVLDVLLGSSPIRLGAPEYGVTFTALDITGWKAAERTVQQNEKTLDALLNATTDLAVLVEPDGTLAAFNDAFARLLGGGSPRALSGASLWELEGLPLDARVRREAAEVARSGRPARVESLHGAQVYDVGIFPIPGPGGIPRVAYFIRDVTSVRQTEEQLRQSQKMEAVGRLAGGIAHDFNNLITVIRGFSELVLGELPGDSRLAEDVAQVKAAADRAAELTARLLTFSRKQVVAPRIVEPAALVRGLEGMLRRVIGEDIAFATDFAADTGRIMADAGQVEQVVMNLAVNARDAMPRGGRLTITAANQLVAERQEPDFPGLAPGEYVR